jgi:hypothetical protein
MAVSEVSRKETPGSPPKSQRRFFEQAWEEHDPDIHPDTLKLHVERRARNAQVRSVFPLTLYFSTINFCEFGFFHACFGGSHRGLACSGLHCTVYPPISGPLYKGRILLRDILGRRWPVGFVRESYPIRGGTL